MLRLFRSLSRFETQDIKTQPQFNHYLIPYVWGWDYVLIGAFLAAAINKLQSERKDGGGKVKAPPQFIHLFLTHPSKEKVKKDGWVKEKERIVAQL